MYFVPWRFWPVVGRENGLGRSYGHSGGWARPFRRGDGYLGTELLRRSGGSRECLALDRWASCAAYEAFRARWNSGYRRLDHRLEELNEEEARLGTFEALPWRDRLACQDTVRSLFLPLLNERRVWEFSELGLLSGGVCCRARSQSQPLRAWPCTPGAGSAGRAPAYRIGIRARILLPPPNLLSASSAPPRRSARSRIERKPR